MKNFIHLLILLWLPLSAEAQQVIKWEDLNKVEFVEFYDRDRSDWSLRAEYSPEILVLDGTSVQITGYIIPLDVQGDDYALSAFAFSSCFFCGGAGPETVMGLSFQDVPDRMSTDDVVKLKGVLRVRELPGQGFHYQLDQVEIIRRY
ncbi:MAG: DUF3299 domain-containing protein [Bacteroidetes bacterium]|nr:MAG: DUF3299 domain-containing protein [Bacteroidota bacterium]